MSFLDRPNSLEKRAGGQAAPICLLSLIRYEYLLQVFSLIDQGDHKPVSAYFEVSLETIIRERFQSIHSAVLRELDKLENEARPVVSVSSEQLQFDTISFLEPSTRSLTLENTGRVIPFMEALMILGNCLL